MMKKKTTNDHTLTRIKSLLETLDSVRSEDFLGYPVEDLRSSLLSMKKETIKNLVILDHLERDSSFFSEEEDEEDGSSLDHLFN